PIRSTRTRHTMPGM
ncbi:hypothetical protein D034_4847B, partial [Vibrio parahaemolyticus Peru-288]